MAAVAAAALWNNCLVRGANNSAEVETEPTTWIVSKARGGLPDKNSRGGRTHRRSGPFSPISRALPRNMNWAVRASAALPPVQLEARRAEVSDAIAQSLDNCLTETHLDETLKGLGPRIRGKVRDIYDVDEYVVLVTTDRQSAFDRVLASVPFKGQVLNETSGWWFDRTSHITANAVVAIPDPNVTIARKCSVFPVEFVVRGYVTGSTSTSLWTVYNRGVRNYCGNILPDGFVKNQRLDENILTPTTKAADHDVPISGKEIVEQGLMSKEDYEEVASRALALFSFGQGRKR